jgi:hypothetical protein
MMADFFQTIICCFHTIIYNPALFLNDIEPLQADYFYIEDVYL